VFPYILLKLDGEGVVPTNTSDNDFSYLCTSPGLLVVLALVISIRRKSIRVALMLTTRRGVSRLASSGSEKRRDWTIGALICLFSKSKAFLSILYRIILLSFLNHTPPSLTLGKTGKNTLSWQLVKHETLNQK